MRFKYKIVYSKRTSIAINISSTNEITVRCPLGVKRERVETFLSEKSAWIEKVVSKNKSKQNLNADIMDYEKIYVGGKKFPLIIGAGKPVISAEGVYVKSLKDLKKLFIDSFESKFVDRVQDVANRSGLKFTSLKIKNYKSRWGCCDAANNLIFNFKLFMLPERIIDYVIVHELCHTVQHNHSEKFWNLVGKFVSDYKIIRKSLRGYDFLTNLY